MANYKLLFKQSVARDLRPLPKADVVRILRRIEALAENPRPPGCEKLSGQEKFRVRQGVYRIVYEVDDERHVVMVVKVGHRRDVYRQG